MNRNSVRSRPMPTAPDCAISGSSSGSSRLACSSTASPSSVSAGRRRSLPKRCRSRAKAVTARRAVASVSGCGFSTTVPAEPSTTTMSPGWIAWARPAAPSTAGTPSARSMTAVWPSAPPSSVATPASRDGSSSAASDGRSDSLISTAPSGRPAKLRYGARVRLRTSRRPISRTSSARRVRPARSSAGMPGSACARIAAAIASASVHDGALGRQQASPRSAAARARIRRDEPSMRM